MLRALWGPWDLSKTCFSPPVQSVSTEKMIVDTRTDKMAPSQSKNPSSSFLTIKSINACSWDDSSVKMLIQYYKVHFKYNYSMFKIRLRSNHLAACCEWPIAPWWWRMFAVLNYIFRWTLGRNAAGGGWHPQAVQDTGTTPAILEQILDTADKNTSSAQSTMSM